MFMPPQMTNILCIINVLNSKQVCLKQVIALTNFAMDMRQNNDELFRVWRYTLNTRPESVAAMLCAFYPRFPNHSNDNRHVNTIISFGLYIVNSLIELLTWFA